jgi:hypothetical protein
MRNANAAGDRQRTSADSGIVGDVMCAQGHNQRRLLQDVHLQATLEAFWRATNSKNHANCIILMCSMTQGSAHMLPAAPTTSAAAARNHCNNRAHCVLLTYCAPCKGNAAAHGAALPHLDRHFLAVDMPLCRSNSVGDMSQLLLPCSRLLPLQPWQKHCIARSSSM